MRVKYLALLFLLFTEFAMGQVPGTPRYLGKSAYPQAFTSAQISDASQAILTGYVIDNGQTAATETGILWGTSTPTLTLYDGGIVSKSGAGTISTTITGLVFEQIVYVRAYAKMGEDVGYGNVEIYEHGTVITETGRKWMAYNLGSNLAKTANDANAYNALYQWGRTTDGHQLKTSAVNNIKVISSLPTAYNAGSVGNSFIQPYNGPSFYLWFNANDQHRSSDYADWLNPENSRLWQGVNGLNNPCPSGYRIPTASEFTDEVNYWALKNQTGAFNSKLKLSTGGWRSFITPGTSNTNSGNGYYWTSTTGINSNEKQKAFVLNIATSITQSLAFKSMAFAVRCIKEYSGSFMSSGGTAQVSSYDCPNSGAQGQLTSGFTASQKDVKQLIRANVTTPGTYNLTTNYTNAQEPLLGYGNGIIFTASGTFTSTGWQDVTLTAAGHLGGPLSNKTFYLVNVAPSCDFFRTEIDLLSGGTAVLSGYKPSDIGINNQVFTAGSTAQVGHTLEVDVNNPRDIQAFGGTFNFSTSATDAQGNTLTFSRSGTLGGTCCQKVVLLSTGKIVVPGAYTFYFPNGYSFTRTWR
jgi:uncharacterized protein (TIGR02145 family)